MRSSLDPLKYGIRALEELAREQASVTPPAPTRATEFSPHPVLRSAPRDGAALSLRLFGETEDDATDLVLGEANAQRFAPIPARAAALFEAHASVRAHEGEEAMTIGFPLVTFLQQGSMRAAPLFSRSGVRARWQREDKPWALPPGAREGVPLVPPDAVVLEVDEEEPYVVHGGVWHHLFGLDGAALGQIAAAGRAGIGALVRAATELLRTGAEDAELGTPDASPPGRDDVAALLEAAQRRAHASRGLRGHPHGLVMLPPRGDPTSSLRTDLGALAGEPLPPRGPLAVYLGATGAPPRSHALFASGRSTPTPSQEAAARAFEGTSDLVAVCGPPGCGKTALLHQMVAQTVVQMALGKAWDSAPSRVAPWPLVVTSTNNGAVDNALAPFVGGEGLPLGLRLGNRRSLAETTPLAIDAAIRSIEKPGETTLAEARATFERLAAPVRAFLDARKDGKKKKEPAAPPLEPQLHEAALALREAWAREHRTLLIPRLVAAREAVLRSGRGKPVAVTLREIAVLFPVAGCTLLSMRASFPLERDIIDRLVIDEAAQCAPIYAVPALARARRAMLTGDVAQLPPIYTLDPHVDDRLARGLDAEAIAPFRMNVDATSSAQSVAEPRSRARLALTEHFRSQPPIVSLASRWSGYTLDVRTPERSLGDVSPRLTAPVIALPTPGEGTRAPEGVVNEAEARAVVALVADLVADGVSPSDIAVLTPFVGQAIRIERELILALGKVLVSTVHRLQGGERRVVIFSVTATERRHLRWLGERPHLLHVATSRAQDHLIILFDPDAAAREPALAPLREL